MIDIPTKITFFDFLMPSIVAGNKTITIRDKSESHYVVGTDVEVFTLETNLKVCDITIESVKAINFDDINEFHAQQEFMELQKLKDLIKQIYPNTNELFVLGFRLLDIE